MRALAFPARNRLRRLDVRSLFAFRTLNDIKGNLLAFFQRLETAHVNCGEVREKIFATIIWSNKAKAFCIIEPLNCTVCHVKTSLLKTGWIPVKLFEFSIPRMAKPVLQIL